MQQYEGYIHLCLQMTYHHRQSRRNTSLAYLGIHFHRHPRNCLRRRARSRRATASCDAPLIKPIFHRATILPISTVRVLNPARRTNPYTSRLIPDHRRNCPATIPCILATGQLYLLNHRAKCLLLKKWVLKFHIVSEMLIFVGAF